MNQLPLPDCMVEYRKQLEKGIIQQAYQGLMAYMMDLRTYFQKKYPDYAVSGSLYTGYMDMSYFSISPQSMKNRSLKIAVVFLHEAFRFEVWLSGYNKAIQTKTWKMIKESGWNKYHLVTTTQGVDSILEHVLVENPDFRDLDALSTQIESGTLAFIHEVEGYLETL